MPNTQFCWFEMWVYIFKITRSKKEWWWGHGPYKYSHWDRSWMSNNNHRIKVAGEPIIPPSKSDIIEMTCRTRPRKFFHKLAHTRKSAMQIPGLGLALSWKFGSLLMAFDSKLTISCNWQIIPRKNLNFYFFFFLKNFVFCNHEKTSRKLKKNMLNFS